MTININKANFPQFNSAPFTVNPSTGQVTWDKTWWMFFLNLFNRTGGTTGVSSADSAVFESIDEANDLGDQVPSLLSKVRQSEINISLILEQGQDAINKSMQALQSAIVEQATMIEVIRSMANQDSNAVAITGGAILNCAISKTISPLGIRSSGANYDLQIGSSEAITSDRLLQIVMNDGARIVTIPHDTTIPIASQALTFTGPSTGRTIKLPDANFTAARTDSGQTFTGNQTITGTLIATAGFGCNGASAQGSYASGSSATAAGSSYSQAQVQSIVTLVNKLQSALISDGICS